MDDWISDLLLFSAGIAAGILITSIKPLFRSGKKQRTELVMARTRVLAGIKEKHEEEILDEAFRTTQAIRSELDQSLATLRKTLNTVVIPAPQINPVDQQSQEFIQLGKPVESN
jgi:hypothetical protein